jgi:hypothetical protein
MSNVDRNMFDSAESDVETDDEVNFGSGVWATSDDVLLTNILIDRGTPSTSGELQRYGGHDLGGFGDFGSFDVWGTGEEILQRFDYLEPDAMYSLQVQLLLNGFDTRNDPDKILWGQPDPISYRAFAKAVGTAARSGKSLNEVLNATTDINLLKKRFGGGRRGATHTNVVQHMAVEDLEAAALRGFQAATGHAPSPEQQQAFIAEFRKRETAAQPSTAGGGTFNVTDPGSPELVAKDIAGQQSPGDTEAYSRLQAFGVMLQALGVQG